MMNLIQLFNSENYIGIPSIDNIPLTEEQLAYAKKVVLRSHDTTGLYAEGGVLKTKSSKNETLAFKTGKVGTSEIVIDGEVTQLITDGEVWMSTSNSSINQLGSQYEDATGDVLVSGLGLGIVALLVAKKPQVKSVTVLEINPDVIALFNLQGFNLDKITILEESVYDHQGRYDVALFDHYNIGVGIPQEHVKTMNIISGTKNFYLWETVYDTYEKYQAVHWMPTRTEEEYDAIIKSHYNLIPDTRLAKSIIKINADVVIPYYFTLENIHKEFDKVQKQVQKRFINIYKDGMFNDYCIYREGDEYILAYGVSWRLDDKLYSAKVQEGVITDLYEIYEDNRSAEIDMDTLEVKYIYEEKGSNKVDTAGNLVQVNHKVKTVDDIPLELRVSLSAVRFPYMGSVFYWADKPYGRVVEFTNGMF